LRIKEQETHLTLQEHDDDDDEILASGEETSSNFIGELCFIFQFLALSLPSSFHLSHPYMYVSSSFLCQDIAINHITIVQLAQFKHLAATCVSFRKSHIYV